VPDLRAIDVEPVSASVLAYLEDLTERARAGEFSTIAVAYVYRDGSTGSGHSDAHNLAAIVGAVEALKTKLIRDMIDGD
jgi:hypothetical protein